MNKLILRIGKIIFLTIFLLLACFTCNKLIKEKLYPRLKYEKIRQIQSQIMKVLEPEVLNCFLVSLFKSKLNQSQI